MKEIYIVLTHTGTVLSKIVRAYTKKPFSHVSIALDRDLQKMYSFGRLKPSNPFFAGFVHEYINKGTFKRFYNTTTKIYSLEVTEEQYEKMEEIINRMEKQKERYKFNILGLFAVAFNIKVRRENTLYCAEFVKYLFDESKINNDLPEIIKPVDFEELKGIKQVYKGLLRNYKAPKIVTTV